jgi:hypothetical protein
VELKFTNADVNMGLNSVIPLFGNEYASFGITVPATAGGIPLTYRYIDGRDPFSDFPNQVLDPDCPNANEEDACNFGLSNNDDEAFARIVFDTAGPVSFDWWVIATTQAVDARFIVLDAFNAVIDDFDAFSGQSSTNSYNGVKSILWSSNLVGFASIANIRFEVDGTAPEPGSALLLTLGLVGLGLRSRRRRT